MKLQDELLVFQNCRCPGRWRQWWTRTHPPKCRVAPGRRNGVPVAEPQEIPTWSALRTQHKLLSMAREARVLVSWPSGSWGNAGNRYSAVTNPNTESPRTQPLVAALMLVGIRGVGEESFQKLFVLKRNQCAFRNLPMANMASSLLFFRDWLPWIWEIMPTGHNPG